jgi:DNA (cytosine-5)-methyltransferase 1
LPTPRCGGGGEMSIKVLNLYSGIGGNRKLWDGVNVTAVELNSDIARIYADFFPDDEVIIGDAHQFLLDHFDEYDFIWASPPCQTHSDIRRMGVDAGQNKPVYPDMSLYQEILFLEVYCKRKFVVENVSPCYTPLVKPTIKINRHLFWSNYLINEKYISDDEVPIKNVNSSSTRYDFNLSDYGGINKRQILRNCVAPKLGKHIFDCAFRKRQSLLFNLLDAQEGEE